jgi:predicted permease
MPDIAPLPNGAAHPDWAHEVRIRLSSLRLNPAREAEIVQELGQHLEDRWQELRAGGIAPEDATRVTLAEFQDGNVLARHMAPLRQAHAQPPIRPGASSRHLLADLWQDLRYTVRVAAKQPGFSATAILTLALGLSATTALFSVAHGVLLKPLPFHESARLVTLLHRTPGPDYAVRNHGPATYFTARSHQQTFEDLGAWDFDEVSMTGRGDPEQVEALYVSHTLLPLLRVQPALGRFFSADDDAPDRPLRAVLTHGYWQRRFGVASDVLGQTLQIDGTPAEVIGVLPASFIFRRTTPALLLPMQLDPATALQNGLGFGFGVVGRLKPGITLSQAHNDMARWIPDLPHQQVFVKSLQPYILPLADDGISTGVRRVLWMLLAAAGVVLLIACGNVANLLLIRAEGRQQEFAMRAALGASHARLARTVLSESVCLALAGGVVALVLAQATLELLRRIAPVGLPRLYQIDIDPAVLLFTLAASVLSGLLFGLVAVWRLARPTAVALKDGGRSASDGPGRHRIRHALVVTQIALALTLLIVSGLMVRTVVAMTQVPAGYTHPEEVQTFRVDIPVGLIDDAGVAAQAYERIAGRLAQVPGVGAVGLSSSITMDGEDNGNSIDVEDAPVPEGQPSPLWRFKSLGPGYVEAMGNHLVAGRSLTWAEIHARHPVVLVSAALARAYWQDPARALGRRIRTSGNNPWREIVGVVADERDDGLTQPATGIVYWPILNESYRWRRMAYAVRSSRVGTPGFLSELQQAVWSVNPNLPLAAVQTLAEIEATAMAQTSFAMTMLAVAASVALVLGAVGIYGVISYVATQRTREIGVRIALGAQMADVRRLFLRHGLWLTATGIVLGIGVALVLTRVMSAMLFGVGPADPLTYAAVSAALAAVVLLATYLPARRAARVDPVVALRAHV